MFGFFRTKQPPRKIPALSDIVELGDLPFIRIVKSMVADNEPAGLNMLVVAYQNQEPLIQATFELAKERPQEGLPTDLRGYIRYLGRRLEQTTDEFGSRRLGWFFQAALVRRASDLAAFSPEFEDDVVDISITLARSAGLLHEVLATNILWSEDDKAHFKYIRTKKEGISYCLQHTMPRHLRANARLNIFAEENDIFLIP